MFTSQQSNFFRERFIKVSHGFQEIFKKVLTVTQGHGAYYYQEVLNMEKHRAIPQGYMTVGEVAKKIGITVRTLQYYDKEGLLSPSSASEGGFRLYTEKELEKLWSILLLRELGYQLSDIKEIMDNPNFDMRNSIERHIEALTKKKERLENLIEYARTIKMMGIIPLTFNDYGDITFDEFINNSKIAWNMSTRSEKSEEFNIPFDFERMQKFIEERLNQPEKAWNDDEIVGIVEGISNIVDVDKILVFHECLYDFTNLIDKDVSSNEVQGRVKFLYYLINNFLGFPLSLNGFSLYAQSFASGGDIGMMNAKHFGEETTDFIAKAIQFYCDSFIAEQK